MAPPITPALPADYAAACRLLAAGRRDPAAAADHILRLLVSRAVDTAGLLVARRGAAVIGAVLSQLTPGDAGSVLPPAGEAAADLARAAVARLRAAGATHVQCLVADTDRADPAPLLAAGFARTTELLSLRRPAGPAPAAAGRLTLVPFAAVAAGVVASTILATYVGSLDCPELDRVRPAGAVLAGYEPAFAGGGFLAAAAGVPVGVGVVTGGPAPELAYLGLTPAARGRGLGRELLAELLMRVGEGDVVTSVDARNAPARRLYAAAGFAPAGARAVYLWLPG